MLRRRDLRLRPAATAVFDTYELLEMIIALLPPTDVNNYRRVAKAWDQLVLQSKNIVQSRALAPVPSVPYDDARAPVRYLRLDTCHSHLPNYDDGQGMRINPLLTRQSLHWKQDHEYRGLRTFRFTIRMPESWIGGHLQESDIEFATAPPVTSMHIILLQKQIDDDDDLTWHEVSSTNLTVESGIRIADLLEIQEEMEIANKAAGASDTGAKILLAQLLTVGRCSNTRHLRSWADKELEFGDGKTQSEIDRNETWLRDHDKRAEDRYIEDCMEEEGWHEDDVGYLVEFFARQDPDLEEEDIEGSDLDGAGSSDDAGDEEDDSSEELDYDTDGQPVERSVGDDEESSDADDSDEESRDGSTSEGLGDYDFQQYGDDMSEAW